MPAYPGHLRQRQRHGDATAAFTITMPMLIRAMQALIYGDLFMRVLYHVRPYELDPGSANALHEKWKKTAALPTCTDKNRNAA